MSTYSWLARACALTVSVLGAGGAAAQPAAYPAQPIKIIVPFPAGAPLDLMTRLTAQELAARMQATVVVENVAGATGMIGAERTARAAADGYTFMMAPFSVLAVNLSLHKNVRYHTLRDFDPVVLLADGPQVLLASQQAPVASMAELLRHAKANPGKLTYASAGAGSSVHVATEVMKHMAGVDITHVPYKGTAPAYADLIPGRVDVMMDGLAPALPRLKNGQLRALAVSSRTRLDALPDVPTIAEAGVPGYDVTPWYGMVAPKGTPPAAIEAVNRHVVAMLGDAGVRQRFADMGLLPRGGTPAEFGAFLAKEIERWRQAVAEAGIRPD